MINVTVDGTTITALGVLITVIGNVALQFRNSKRTDAKIDANTATSEAARSNSQANSVTLTGVLARVEAAKNISAATSDAMAHVAAKVSDVIVKVDAVKTDVADLAVQARTTTGLTQELRALVLPPGAG